jgi:hypothetical protein
MAGIDPERRGLICAREAELLIETDGQAVGNQDASRISPSLDSDTIHPVNYSWFSGGNFAAGWGRLM